MDSCGTYRGKVPQHEEMYYFVSHPHFSSMKIIKSKYRSTMTDDHLEVCLRLPMRSYCPDYASLADSVLHIAQYEFIQLCKVHQDILYK